MALDQPLTRRIGLIHRDGPLSPAAAAFLTLAVPGQRPAAACPPPLTLRQPLESV